MGYHLKGILYRILIDPLLNGPRAEVLKLISRSDRIIDIACGTGTLAIEMAKRSGEVTGIDLDEGLIAYAINRQKEEALKNLDFKILDASDLSCFSEKEYDIAITSMAIHQFEPLLAIKILSEMKRIASKVLIADYNFPLPGNIPGKIARQIEHLAGGDHYRNFKNYNSMGGMKYFITKAGLSLCAESIRGGGVFVVALCE
jgi:2-polyprenyl-3-methyl-5-hydroxy-6-metoxy-1,4-benzoquinol methylase